jgi:hypothetical protein
MPEPKNSRDSPDQEAKPRRKRDSHQWIKEEFSEIAFFISRFRRRNTTKDQCHEGS